MLPAISISSFLYDPQMQSALPDAVHTQLAFQQSIRVTSSSTVLKLQ